MWFQKTFTVPAGTEKLTPYTTSMPISAGTICLARFQMCPGAHKYCGVKVFRYGQQLYPLSSEEWIELDEAPLDFADEYKISEPPWELYIHAHAENALFDHEVTVGISILEETTPGVLGTLVQLLTPKGVRRGRRIIT